MNSTEDTAVLTTTDENCGNVEEISNASWDWAAYFFGGDSYESEDMGVWECCRV